MLTYDDAPTIRNAILKRLDKERGVKVCEIAIEPHLGPLAGDDQHIAVGVLYVLDSEHDGPILRSIFHLPAEFEHRHLLNEIDEVCEHAKMARVDVAIRGKIMRFGEQRTLLGTGLRGRWAQYA
jgi:hypothetical protein